MARKRVSVTNESSTGRNRRFRDNYNYRNMSRSEFVSRIRNGEYPNHHVRNINGVATPVSNPDASRNNNLD